MELVQPVAIRSAEFCVVCSLSMRVFAVLGSQEGCAYERMDGSDVLFVYLSDVFFGVIERYCCECSEDVQTCFCFCVYVLYVLSKRYSSVIGPSKCGGIVCVWDHLTVQRDGRLPCVFAVPWIVGVSVDFVVETTYSLFVWCNVSSVCILVDVWRLSRSWGIAKRLLYRRRKIICECQGVLVGGCRACTD